MADDSWKRHPYAYGWHATDKDGHRRVIYVAADRGRRRDELGAGRGWRVCCVQPRSCRAHAEGRVTRGRR